MYSLLPSSRRGVVREEVVELAHIDEATGFLHPPHILRREILPKFQLVEKQQRRRELQLNPHGYLYMKEDKIEVLPCTPQ